MPGSQRDRNARVRSRPFSGSMPAEVDDVYPCTDQGEASDGKDRPFAEVDDANSLDQRRRKAGSSPAGAQQYQHKCPFACQVARLATKQDCRLALSEASTAPPADKKNSYAVEVQWNTPGRTALRCNGDVQVPYRFPITEKLHEACGRCALDCASQQEMRQAQVNQAAQAGYACDYQNKRLPIAVHEVRHKELETELQDNPHGFARGVCRGAVECVNLVDHVEHNDPTAAEATKRGQNEEMSLHLGLQLL